MALSEMQAASTRSPPTRVLSVNPHTYTQLYSCRTTPTKAGASDHRAAACEAEAHIAHPTHAPDTPPCHHMAYRVHTFAHTHPYPMQCNHYHTLTQIHTWKQCSSLQHCCCSIRSNTSAAECTSTRLLLLLLLPIGHSNTHSVTPAS